MITVRKKIGWTVLGLALTIGICSSAAHAQSPSPTPTDSKAASIQKTGTDLKNKKVFATVTFDGQTCATYHLRFKLKKNTEPEIYQTIKVLNDPIKRGAVIGTYVFKQNTDGTTSTTWTVGSGSYVAELINGDSVMIPNKAANAKGFNIELDLTPVGSVRGEDSIEVCMESIVFASECKRCGVNNSDMVFTNNDIASDCPYKGKDVLACYQRDSKAGNWEAWIRDQRDCQAYRIVEMPDERWWFAQNLNRYEDGASTTKPVLQANAGPVPSNADQLASAWCPNGGMSDPVTGATNVIVATNYSAAAATSCATYGALYTWATAMSNDGYATAAALSSVQHSMGIGQSGTRRAICPEGWYVPSRSDWGKMLNMVENNCSACEGASADGSNATAAGKNSKNSNCFHNFKDVTTNAWAASKCAYRDLLSTDVAPYIAMNGTDVNYNGGVSVSMTDSLVRPVSKLENPNTIRTYATYTNPAWNYFKPETAGTDRWGFSIKPTGIRNADGAGFTYLGEFAGFWTSSHASTTSTPTYATTKEAFMVGFRYNYRLNSDFNSAIQSAKWDKNYGLAVRCIAHVPAP